MLASPAGPFFSLPIINKITPWVIEKCLTWLVGETAIGLSLLWIQVEMSFDIKNAESSRKKLQDMLLDPKKYTAEETKQLEDFFDETTISLIQLELSRL